MSFALKELSRLIAENAPVAGVVVNVEGIMVRVATERGAVIARALDILTVGDRVLINNGIATRAPMAHRRHVYPV